jgi:alcohol-forming fatty acyl-CoA reductase
VIGDRLAGARIGVTGATGFLGTALVERILRCLPEATAVLVVRPGRRAGAEERVRREVLRNDCFDRLREELGSGFDELVTRRVEVVAGDVASEGLALDEEHRHRLASCDVVVHSAASVSFDSPLDSAVEVNLLGPSRVASVLAGADRPAHLVSVSTAYVAGTRRGSAPEVTLDRTPYAARVDWRSEAAAAARARDDAESESRRPAELALFRKEARDELGAAGTPLLADRGERKREEWVRKRLVEAGRARAQALGWPDAYAYSKALGEWALLENRGGVPVTVVRPSIIESALSQPRPGWIRGFRMAEPVIISYARGLLGAFPGTPEGVVDVIPVDLVVSAILAVAAEGPDPLGPDVYHLSSGARNPLTYGNLVRLVQSWFTEHPLYDADGQPIVVPDFSFPGRGAVQRQLNRVNHALGAAEKVLASVPLRGRRAELSARIDERRLQVDRALGYVELYGSYAESEVTFGVDRLLSLWERQDDTDRAPFCFDPAAIDWDSYVRDVHLPSVVTQARVRTRPGKKRGPSRDERGRRAVLSPERHLAAFDLENTLIASNVVESYAWLATRRLPDHQRARFTIRTLREVPGLLSLDRRDRGDFLRHFYRRYENAPVARVRQDAWELFSGLILAKSFPAGIRRVREHRALGHRTVLITGALDFVVEPLRPLFDDVVCAHLGERAGVFTGELESSPPTGEARAQMLADYAAERGLSLAESVAYADSASDLPMLEAVGHPVAVNPETKLASIARKRGWHVEHWDVAHGSAKPLLPIGPRT